LAYFKDKMSAYYNEIDPFAAQWLRNLISAGLIAPGEVDTRSIEDVRPDDLRGFTQCHFFAGIGVWSHALRQAGWPDDQPVWTGSCPCQPFSTAGKAGGFADERHLWPAFFHLISERRPHVVFGEQVASADGLGWFDLVQTDLENEGYTAAAIDLCAAGVGAPHIRQRLYWVGHADDEGLEGYAGDGDERRGKGEVRPVAEAGSPVGGFWSDAQWLDFRDGKRRPVQPGLSPMAGRTPNHMGRLRAYGNALVAPLATEFITAFMQTQGA
jgi:DNA (cytosine-5)-methyltransferase 1